MKKLQLFSILWFVCSLIWFVFIGVGLVGLALALSFICWDLHLIAEAFHYLSWEWIRGVWVVSCVAGFAMVCIFFWAEGGYA